MDKVEFIYESDIEYFYNKLRELEEEAKQLNLDIINITRERNYDNVDLYYYHVAVPCAYISCESLFETNPNMWCVFFV